MKIFADTEAALATLNVPFGYEDLLTNTGSELPNTFLVYFLITEMPVQFADDEDTERKAWIQVSAYSRTGFADDLTGRIEAAMKAAGFTPGPVTKLPYDQVTRHFGLSLEYSKMRSNENDESDS
jgi:hypothetical protein